MHEDYRFYCFAFTFYGDWEDHMFYVLLLSFILVTIVLNDAVFILCLGVINCGVLLQMTLIIAHSKR